MPNVWFRLMALEYKARSKPPLAVEALKDAGVAAGASVLDFGCGPGRYTIPAAFIAGSKGVVYAVDVHPLAIRMVGKAARRSALGNIRLIQSSCATGLESASVDVAFLFDTLHDVRNKEAVLQEIRRVLKQDGRLLYRDHTLNGPQLVELMRSNGFGLHDESGRQYFVKL